MIRYSLIRPASPAPQPLTLANLHAAILHDAANHLDAEVKKSITGWLDKARDRTKQLIDLGDYLDREKWKKLPAADRAGITEPIAVDWADVKYLYREIQHNKCAYCERKLPVAAPQLNPPNRRRTTGAGEHDVEHFRPKNAVKRWPPGKGPALGAPHGGYYWLAFDLLNYCTVCITCNRELKGSYFPIAGVRGAAHAPLAQLNATEQPLLIYPLGSVDDDPEDVIRFIGINAFPPCKDPFLPPQKQNDVLRNQRATTTIEFYDLNGRVDLLQGRAERIRELEKAFALCNHGTPKEQADAADDVVRLRDESSDHTACVRAMIRLYQNNVAVARQIFELVREVLATKTPAAFVKKAGKFREAPWLAG
jgi:hypothetical protein